MGREMTEESARQLLNLPDDPANSLHLFRIIEVDVTKIQITQEILNKFDAVLSTEIEKAGTTDALGQLIMKQVRFYEFFYIFTFSKMCSFVSPCVNLLSW